MQITIQMKYLCLMAVGALPDNGLFLGLHPGKEKWHYKVSHWLGANLESVQNFSIFVMIFVSVDNKISVIIEYY